jgi:hypothetical protein
VLTEEVVGTLEFELRNTINIVAIQRPRSKSMAELAAPVARFDGEELNLPLRCLTTQARNSRLSLEWIVPEPRITLPHAPFPKCCKVLPCACSHRVQSRENRI